MLFKRPNSAVWWMRFTEAGKQIRESTKETDYAKALVAHARRLQGQQPVAKDTVGYLLDGLILDYELNGQNLKFVHQWVENHLRKYFGDMKIEAVTKETIKDFIVAKKDTLSNASMNRCIALLKRAWNIAELKFPKVEMLRENNTRKGFVESDRFWTLFNSLPEHARPVVLFCYETGARIQEALGIKWEQVDFLNNVVRFAPGETKNAESRVVPCSEMMMFFFKRKLPHCSAYVFTYKGRHLTSIKTAWGNTVKKLGWPYKDLLVHDLRRSAVRNFVRSGVSEKVAMKISGHKSRSVFDRYNVTDEVDLTDAMKKLTAKQPGFMSSAPEVLEFEAYQKEE